MEWLVVTVFGLIVVLILRLDVITIKFRKPPETPKLPQKVRNQLKD